MAKRVADISSETNSFYLPAISNMNSKNSKTVGKKGGARIARFARRKRREFNDTINKKSPQPEASFKEDINIEDDDNNECIEEEGHDLSNCIDEWHDHNKCIEDKEDAMKWAMLNLKNKVSRKRESPQHDCISIPEQQKVPGSPQRSSLESIKLDKILGWAEFSGWDKFSGWVDDTMEGSSPPPTP